MSSGANRRLTRYTDNPGADPDGVEDDRGADERADVEDDRPEYVRGDDQEDDVDVGDDEQDCEDCGATAEYGDPRAALGHDSLPSYPLCRSCILSRV
jgi:hypothetical protein